MKSLVPTILLTFFSCAQLAGAAELPAAESLSSEPQSPWFGGIGEGYRKGANLWDARLTRGYGTTMLNGNVTHDLVLARIQYSRSLHDVWAPDHWWGGNLSWTGEVMGGIQDRPELANLVMGNLGLRYELATGKLAPYVAIAIGIGATDIGAPDLGGVLQFGTQVGLGLRYHLNATTSLTLGVDYLHVSNASSQKPNAGVNDFLINLGVGWAY